jgi:hypothetical protein
MLSSLIALARAIQISRTANVYFAGWITIGMLSIVVYIFAGTHGLTFHLPEYSILVVAGLISLCLLFFGLFGLRSRVGVMLAYLALWMATRPVGLAFTYLLASLDLPLVDSALDSFDRALGFDWLSWYNFVNESAGVKAILVGTYASLSLQIVFSIVYFSHREEGRSNNELWWAGTIALVLTTIVSGIFPAAGTFEHYGVTGGIRGVHLHDLYALRHGAVTSFSVDEMIGIITLPSYHTVMAILLTYIYRSQRRMFRIVLPLNVVQLIAIPSEGGHYISDVLAGGAVAIIAILIVQRTRLGTHQGVQPVSSWRPRAATGS